MERVDVLHTEKAGMISIHGRTYSQDSNASNKSDFVKKVQAGSLLL